MPNIDLNAPCESTQHFYTLEALKVFHRLNEDRKIWENLPNSMDTSLKGKELEKEEENIRDSSLSLKGSFSTDALRAHSFLRGVSMENSSSQESSSSYTVAP